MDAVKQTAVPHESDVVIVGFGYIVVDETRARVRSAFASHKLELPSTWNIIDLARADMPIDSTSFDLSIAAAILMVNEPRLDRTCEEYLYNPLGRLSRNTES